MDIGANLHFVGIGLAPLGAVLASPAPRTGASPVPTESVATVSGH